MPLLLLTMWNNRKELSNTCCVIRVCKEFLHEWARNRTSFSGRFYLDEIQDGRCNLSEFLLPVNFTDTYLWTVFLFIPGSRTHGGPQKTFNAVLECSFNSTVRLQKRMEITNYIYLQYLKLRRNSRGTSTKIICCRYFTDLCSVQLWVGYRLPAWPVINFRF